MAIWGEFARKAIASPSLGISPWIVRRTGDRRHFRPHFVMPGLVPGIHVPPPPRPRPARTAMPQDVDARNKSGHDGGRKRGSVPVAGILRPPRYGCPVRAMKPRSARDDPVGRFFRQEVPAIRELRAARNPPARTSTVRAPSGRNAMSFRPQRSSAGLPAKVARSSQIERVQPVPPEALVEFEPGAGVGERPPDRAGTPVPVRAPRA